MRNLRTVLILDVLILTSLSLGRVFVHPGSPPLLYLEISRDTIPVELSALALGALTLALWLSTDLPLIADRQRLAVGLGLVNLLMGAAFFLQMAFWGAYSGLLAATFFALAAALVRMGLRSRKPEEAAIEIATLKIPEEIRQGLLRQIGEAAAQEERNRLARDLHDSVKQQLFSINVGTATAQERWERDPEGARKALVDVRRSAREAMVEMQAMLHQLQPKALGTAGLIEALREQCEAMGYRSGAEVTLELGEPVPDDRMPPGAPETLFRIAQEMLANMARHSRASRVRLWLGWQEEEAMLRIEDDGQGFDPSAEVSGMGLRNLKERAASLRGSLEIASAPGAGAVLTVRIPLVAPAAPPVPEERRREVFSEFLALLAAAGIVSWPLWTGPAAEGAAAGAEISSPWMVEVSAALVLIMIAAVAWQLGRPSPSGAKRFLNWKVGSLLALSVGGWWVQSAPDLKAHTALELWTLPVASLLFAAGALIWVHRVSKVRRVWGRGSRAWLWLLLPVAITLAVTVAWIFDRPGPLHLTASDAFLLAPGLVFPYLISRQRRGEGDSR